MPFKCGELSEALGAAKVRLKTTKKDELDLAPVRVQARTGVRVDVKIMVRLGAMVASNAPNPKPLPLPLTP